jgi:hypothetical protein
MGFPRNTRVVLRRGGFNSPGVVVGDEEEGRQFVRLDSGTSASFPVEYLHGEGEDKSWPPKTLETK